MKYLIASLLIKCLCIDCTFYQSPGKYQGFQKTKESSSFTFGDILANPLKDGSLVEARVSQLALTAFKNSYPNFTSFKWYRVGRNYLVYFKANKNMSRALYDARGNLISSFFYGYEKDLPPEVRNLLKIEYPDYEILVTTEIYEDDRKFWVINLGNDKSLAIVSTEWSSLIGIYIIQEMSRYKRSK